MGKRFGTIPKGAPGSVIEECGIGFGVDLDAGKVIVQFDRHVRAIGLDADATVELIASLCTALNELGVRVVRDDPPVTH